MLEYLALTECIPTQGLVPTEARNGSNSSKAKTKAKDTGLRSRSSSRAQEARNVSDSSKMKKAKDTKQSSKPSSASDDGELRVAKELGPVPTFRN